jgi:hypothetical protein
VLRWHINFGRLNYNAFICRLPDVEYALSSTVPMVIDNRFPRWFFRIRGYWSGCIAMIQYFRPVPVCGAGMAATVWPVTDMWYCYRPPARCIPVPSTLDQRHYGDLVRRLVVWASAGVPCGWVLLNASQRNSVLIIHFNAFQSATETQGTMWLTLVVSGEDLHTHLILHAHG